MTAGGTKPENYQKNLLLVYPPQIPHGLSCEGKYTFAERRNCRL